MAQKLEAINAASVPSLLDKYAVLAAEYEQDPRFLVTPVGFVYDGAEYVVLMLIEAPHKRKFDDEEAEGG